MLALRALRAPGEWARSALHPTKWAAPQGRRLRSNRAPGGAAGVAAEGGRGPRVAPLLLALAVALAFSKGRNRIPRYAGPTQSARGAARSANYAFHRIPRPHSPKIKSADVLRTPAKALRRSAARGKQQAERRAAWPPRARLTLWFFCFDEQHARSPPRRVLFSFSTRRKRWRTGQRGSLQAAAK